MSRNEGIIIHPMITFLVRELEMIYSSYHADRFFDAIDRCHNLTSFLREDTRKKLEPLIRDFNEIEFEAKSLAYKEAVGDGWDDALTIQEHRNQLAEPSAKKIIEALTKELYIDYLTMEKWSSFYDLSGGRKSE